MTREDAGRRETDAGIAETLAQVPAMTAWLKTLVAPARRNQGKVPARLRVTALAREAWRTVGVHATTRHVTREHIEAALAHTSLPSNLDTLLRSVASAEAVQPPAARREGQRRDIAAIVAREPLTHPTAQRWWAGLGPTRQQWYGQSTAHLAVLEQLIRTLNALPPEGTSLTVPTFAAAVHGDAHALDSTNRLGRRWLLALRETAPDTCRALPGRAGRAAVLAHHGLAVDGISSRVIVAHLNAPPYWTVGPQQAIILPLLTVQALAAWPGPARTPVCVVENPAVFQALLEHTRHPLVCTSGFPSLATQHLLRLAANAGCPLWVSTDWDEAGFRIADTVARATQGRMHPWGCPNETPTRIPEEHRIPLLLASLPSPSHPSHPGPARSSG